MAEQHVAERIGGHLGHDLGGGGIGKMAVAGQDPLLHRPRAPGVVLQESFVVVGLDQECVHPTDRFHDLAGGVAEVGEHREPCPVGPQNKSDRIGGVVRDRKRQHLDVPQRESRSARKQIPARPDSRPFEMVGGERVGEHRHPVLRDEHLQALRVVAVLVGEQNAGKRFRSDPARFQAGAKPACAQARIHQHATVPGTHQQRVPRTPAGQHGHLKHAAD